MKGFILLNEETMSHIVQSHPRQTGHSEEFWQNVVHWRRKLQLTPVFLSGEYHEHYEKGDYLVEYGGNIDWWAGFWAACNVGFQSGYEFQKSILFVKMY